MNPINMAARQFLKLLTEQSTYILSPCTQLVKFIWKKSLHRDPLGRLSAAQGFLKRAFAGVAMVIN